MSKVYRPRVFNKKLKIVKPVLETYYDDEEFAVSNQPGSMDGFDRWPFSDCEELKCTGEKDCFEGDIIALFYMEQILSSGVVKWADNLAAWIVDHGDEWDYLVDPEDENPGNNLEEKIIGSRYEPEVEG